MVRSVALARPTGAVLAIGRFATSTLLLAPPVIYGLWLRFPSAAPFHPPGLRNSVGTPLRAGPRVRTCSGGLCVVRRALIRRRGARGTRGRVPARERPVRRACIPCCGVTHRSGRSNAPPFVGAVAGRVVVCHLSPTAVHHSALPSPPNLAALPLSHSATACRRRRSMEASAETTAAASGAAPAELTPREVGLLGPYLELRDVRCDCAGHFSPAQLLESTIYVVE